MCEHKNLIHTEVIEAYHRTSYFNGEPHFNNEYGNQIRKEVDCLDCREKWVINRNSPVFIKNFDEKVELDRETKM